MNDEIRVYTEVYTVLNRLPNEYIIKIPEYITKAIFEKADTSCSYKIGDMLPQSKAMIFEIIRKYFQDEEFNKKAMEYINYCTKKDLMQNNKQEEKLQQTMHKNDIFPKYNNEHNNTNKNLPIETSKNNLFMKIIDYIKSIFKRR